MNQTNFGYNPARNTLVTGNGPKNANDLILDSINSGGRVDRGSLNTQKRNRTSTIDGSTGP